jgi:hypothetical protein
MHPHFANKPRSSILFVGFFCSQIVKYGFSYFSSLRIKNYGCLKFLGEVCARRACVVLNEEDLTTCAKRARNGRFGVFFEKNGLEPLGVKLFF